MYYAIIVVSILKQYMQVIYMGCEFLYLKTQEWKSNTKYLIFWPIVASTFPHLPQVGQQWEQFIEPNNEAL